MLKNPGYALDLGCGKGTDVLSLALLGFQVDAIDADGQITENLQNDLQKEENKNLKVQVHTWKIEDFAIEKEKYDCVIASNSLPFLDSKEKTTSVIKNIVAGLKKDGCMYITLFGTKDEWAKKITMNFFEYHEIKSFLDSLEIQFYHSTIEEGFGKTMKGDIKYWNIFKFIYIKN